MVTGYVSCRPITALFLLLYPGCVAYTSVEEGNEEMALEVAGFFHKTTELVISLRKYSLQDGKLKEVRLSHLVPL